MSAQNKAPWPVFNEDIHFVSDDWLLGKLDAKAQLFQDANGQLVFSNGLVSRTFTTTPNGATVALELLTNNESFLRSVRPEAELILDGLNLSIGGLIGQPIHNYLLPEWIQYMKTAPNAFQLVDYRLEEIKERFAWQKRTEWMTQDLPWPPPGKELVFTYQLNDEAIGHLSAAQMDDGIRNRLVYDDFKSLNKAWKSVESTAHSRNSFINEGKPGEVMALANTAVFAEQKCKKGSKVFMVRIDPGTDQSVSWGPGIACVMDGHSIKLNLRPARQEFGFFDGEKESVLKGMQSGKPVWLRLKRNEDKMEAAWSYDQKVWNQAGHAKIASGSVPDKVRVGKMDWAGGASDHADKGEMGRCRIEEFMVLGDFPEEITTRSKHNLDYLKAIIAEVHYECYDNLPLFSKWVTIRNQSDQPITLNKIKSEVLAVNEPVSSVGVPPVWVLPNITIETDYAFGGGMSSTSSINKSVFWNEDPLYKTQVNYERQMPVLLECYPQYGPDQILQPGDEFTSFRTWELLHDSWDRERKGLAIRRMYRTIAPWITENPILMHVRKADDASVKKAIDQCAEAGFEMVIMTFGSGFNAEDESPENRNRLKELADYAHSKGIALGGYSLLASRRIGDGQDVVMPKGMAPTFGNSPCLESDWGHHYFKKMYGLFEATGLDIFEHDGSYPGDPCLSESHPGHRGLDDSQWNQFQRIKDFYHWCRGKGIYLNVPDWYFLNGSNKTGMGYRETNWSLPREQQEIIERQNIYDGTWEKTPSMGWMFVPLVQYHGGGSAATIEPLREHLPHYGQRLANLFGAGVQACYRGPQLYDAPETKAVVKQWVDFYKQHRQVLDGDIVHVRRPDGRDYDAILHVNPQGEEKGLLMVYNPLNEPIRRTLKVNLYYTGLTGDITSNHEGNQQSLQLDASGNVSLEIEIPARSQSWWIFK